MPPPDGHKQMLKIDLDSEHSTETERIAASCRAFVTSLGHPIEMSLSRPCEPAISVVVPMLNEEANLATLHARLTQVHASLDMSNELVLVNDGSTHGTHAVGSGRSPLLYWSA